MKSLILYASPHHGNTKKVAERMAKKIGARLVDVIREEPPDLAGYRLIGLASGAYFGTLHKSIVNLCCALVVHLPQTLCNTEKKGLSSPPRLR